MTDTEQRLLQVRRSLTGAAAMAKRDDADITLIAVSKTFEAEAIRSAIAAGQKIFGENRVQESQGKWPELKRDHPDVELHLIGPLQSNKTKDAVALFDVIHTIDRKKIADSIAAEMARQDKTLRLFIQINTGEEPQKAGVAPAGADGFIDYCRKDLGLEVEGLMCIPPADQHPGPHFALLAKIAERNGLSGLSMGMSADYEDAIMLGATHVRVGSAIFGTRG